MGALILRWLWKPFAVLLALLAVWLRGRSSAKQQTALEAAKKYRDTRKEIDHADLGLGASDSERIKRLQALANKR